MSAPRFASEKMWKGRRRPVTERVTERVTEKVTERASSPSSSPALLSTCDCKSSLKKIRTFFTTWQKALRSSGVLEEDEPEGGRRKRRRKTGGFPARGRRKLKRAQERMSMSASSTRTPTPSPFDMSSVIYSDDAWMYNGEGDVIPDSQGQANIELAESVSQVVTFQRESHSGHRLGKAR